MNILNDNWLDGFTKHPIFQVKPEYLELINKYNAKRTRYNFALQHHSQVITLRENDLFVAVGSEIRVINLTTCKNNWMKGAQDADFDWIEATPYFILNTPEINFPVESLTTNKNGRLLAVKGSNKLVVICLPRQGFTNYPAGKKVLCRTLSIGTNYYDANKTEILKVEWHPLSETRTHIVVLGNDNYLRLFDISMDIEEPEQSFDLSPVQQKPLDKTKSKIGFSFDDEDNTDEDAVSFSLGGPSKDSSGWEPFTVFYTLRNGHMYALCPVIPYRSSLRRSHLDSLSCISYAKHEQSKNSDSDDRKTLSYLYNLQCSWISALVKSAKIARKTNPNNLDADTLLVSSDAEHSAFPVQRQGPFLVSQAVNFEAGIEATDILHIYVDPLNIITLAFTDGSVHNYIVGSEIDAQWQMPIHNPKNSLQKKLGYLLSDSSFLPAASLYEAFNVKSAASPAHQAMHFVADPLYEDTYYVYHSGGIQAISMNKWVQNLCRISASYEQGHSEQSKKELEGWLKEKSTSEIRLLIDSSPFKDGYIPFIGLAVITDMYLSYSILTLTSGYQMVVRDLYVRRDSSANKASQEAIKLQLKNLQNQDTSANDGYQSLLPLPAYQPPAQLNALPKQPKIVVPASMNGSKEIVINEETMRFFSDSSIEIRRETHAIKKIATKIDARLCVQQKEFERQVKSLQDLYGRLQKVNSADHKTAQEEKLEKICKNHAKLRLRIDEQLRLLMQSYQPDLSNEEKKWINKLEKLQEKVSGESGYSARVELLKSQMKQLEPSTINREKLSNLNPTQLKTILRTLQQQELTIDQVEKRLKGFENKVSLTAV